MEETTIYVNVAQNKEAIQKLQQTLLELHGIERALVDIEDGEVKITYNHEKLSHENILSTISRNGFDILP
ncbi:heavy-metal-associated domain-containing protein [Siminovitchia sediminis]|uniref:Heavy-metal-associated domain-containing protein n=1 Tax=Siminovitchia sediminis TaxID=1274353 RepID=A0ABW4KDY0_9BACI